MHPFQHFLFAGFNQVAEDTWTNDEQIVIQANFINMVPDLPASLTDPYTLRRLLAGMTAAKGAGLIEADVLPLGGQPALRQIIKVRLPHQPHGQAFIGTFIVPKATCSAVLKVQAVESGMTGQREAVVMAQVGPDNYFRPHPYGADVEGGLPSHVADDRHHDPYFPQHPLTRVRLLTDQLARQVTLHPGYAALPPFHPAPPQGGQPQIGRAHV